MNKCDIGQLKVHDVEVCPLYYQLVPDRLVRSKKVLRLYLSLYQPMLDFFPKSLDEFTVPEKMDQAFCVLFAESTCLLKKCLFYKDNHSLQFSCEEA